MIEINNKVQKFSMAKVFPVLQLVVGTWYLTKIFYLHNTHQKRNCRTLFL